MLSSLQLASRFLVSLQQDEADRNIYSFQVEARESYYIM